MTPHGKRLEKLEAALAPTGKPFVIWVTGKSHQEIEAEIAGARASGQMAANDWPMTVSWKDPT